MNVRADSPIVTRGLTREAGDDGATQTRDGARLLFEAASRGDYAAVRALLEDKAADVNARDRFGNTALIYAAGGGHAGVVRLLVAAGADALAANQAGVTALGRAESQGHYALALILLRAGAGGEALRREAQTKSAVTDADRALVEAARGGDTGRVASLVADGADLESCPPEVGTTPLIAAAVAGHVLVVSMLLAAGADPDARGYDGATPLRRASSLGDTEVMRVLLAHGADPDARDGDGRTVLMEAAREDNRASASLLLAHGARAGLADRFGETARSHARRHGHTEMAELLARDPH